MPARRLGPPSSAQAITRHPLFADIEARVRDDLAAHARVETHGTGSVVVEQGARPDAVFGVVSGRVKVSLGHASGAASTIAVLGPGDLCGELGVLGAVSRAAAVTALSRQRANIILRELAREGLVGRAGRRIVVRDVDRLRRASEDSLSGPSTRRR